MSHLNLIMIRLSNYGFWQSTFLSPKLPYFKVDPQWQGVYGKFLGSRYILFSSSFLKKTYQFVARNFKTIVTNSPVIL